MADGTNINIRLAATGADAAAAEIRKLEASLGIVTKSEKDLAQARAQFMTAAEAEVAEIDRLTASVKRLSAALPQVPFSQSGNVISELANGPLKNGTAGVKNLGMTFTQVGYQVTDFTTQVSMGTSAFTAFAQQAPQAIAALTQFGGAGTSFAAAMSASVGAMLPLSLLVTELAIGIPMFLRAAKETEQALNDEVEAGNRAEEMFQQLKTVLEYGAEAYYGAANAAANLKDITDESTASIDAERQAIENRNRVLNADDSAYNAKRDREDAAKIRGGADKENVQIDRANFDESQALAKLDREKEAREAGAKTARDSVIKGQVQVDIAKVSPDADEAKIAAAETALKALQDRLEKMESANEVADRIDSSKRTEIREKTAGKIEGLVETRTKRKETEAQKAADKEEKENRDRARAQGREDTSDRKDAGDAGRKGRAAEGLLPKGVSDKFRQAVESVSDGLQDGDQGGEMLKLLGLMEQLAAAVKKKGDSSLARRIEILEQQIKSK